MCRWQHHAHPVDVTKASQGYPLIFHAVLTADNRGRQRGHRSETVEGLHRVLTLDRQDNQIALADRQFGGIINDWYPQGHDLSRSLQTHSIRGDGCVIVAARDEGDVVAVLKQFCADPSPDGPRPKNNHSHVFILAPSLGRATSLFTLTVVVFPPTTCTSRASPPTPAQDDRTPRESW